MVLPASDIVLPSSMTTQNSIQIDDNVDICLSTAEHFHELNFMPTEESKPMVRRESPEKEKQISVDPISLRESSRREASFNLMLPPVVTAPDLPTPLPLLKPRLVSSSLPNSAASSPRFSFALLRKKLKNESQASPRQIDNLALRQPVGHSHLTLQEFHLRRSKSCAEGRLSSPADELDIWFTNPIAAIQDDNIHDRTFSKSESTTEARKKGKKMDPEDEGFKCGALCLYLPGFGKAKPVRSRREEVVEAGIGNIISRTVSLEKFECGSWASSAIMNDHEDGDSMNHFFDLPLEMIRTSVNDTTSPVAAAFLFDKDRKGVLKNTSTRATPCRKSHESARHVRFSTSSPSSHPASPASCITPRLRKAREDFNAFLEAQSA